ncbi:MAG: CYTH domain-containing protein [Firmicutes bacterium]|nr:CYTH domain-containing protein [Bacillota bacterium]
MEIELKYSLTDNLAKDRILNDHHLAEMKDSSCDETLHMKAIYFDTAEGDLQRFQIALRARHENDRIVVTLKWKGSAQDGLHIRGELNVPGDETYLENPTVEVFRGSEIFEELEEAVSGKQLIPVMEMDYIRKSIQVDTGASISVISLDEGVIRAGDKEAEILEVEVELYSGEQRDMIALGEELASKYNLVSNDQSKFQRGLELLKAE